MRDAGSQKALSTLLANAYSLARTALEAWLFGSATNTASQRIETLQTALDAALSAIDANNMSRGYQAWEEHQAAVEALTPTYQQRIAAIWASAPALMISDPVGYYDQIIQAVEAANRDWVNAIQELEGEYSGRIEQWNYEDSVAKAGLIADFKQAKADLIADETIANARRGGTVKGRNTAE